MAVSRITNYVNGNTLTGPQLNAEFDNILTNGVAVAFPATGAMDFSTQALSNVVLENLAAHTASTVTGRVYVYTPQNYLALVLTSGASLAAGVRYLGPNGAHSAVYGLTGSLISNIGSFAAVGYNVHRSFDGVLAVNATSSYSVNTQTAGPVANGRDQAAVFASTDVHFYAITTGYQSTSPQGLASSVPPPVGPTLPTNYQNWAYLCSAKYSTGSSAMPLASVISGSRVFYSTNASGTGQALVSAGAATVLTSTPTGAETLVPSIATQMQISVGLQTGLAAGGVGSINVSAFIAPASTTLLMQAGRLYALLSSGSGGEIGQGGLKVSLPVVTNPPAVYYQNLIQTGTSGTLSLNLDGYTVPNGGAG